MKKWIKRLDSTLFDVASGPILLAFFGVAAVIAIAAIALVILAIVLIRRALRKNKAVSEAIRTDDHDQRKASEEHQTTIQ